MSTTKLTAERALELADKILTPWRQAPTLACVRVEEAYEIAAYLCNCAAMVRECERMKNYREPLSERTRGEQNAGLRLLQILTSGARDE